MKKPYFIKIIMLLALFSLFLNCQSSSSSILKISKNKFKMEHAEISRTGNIYVPESYDGSKPFSLVIGLHGRGGNADGFQSFGFDPIAENLEYIMVYPNGYEGMWDLMPGTPTLIDDLGFFKLLIQELQIKYNINPDRIYVTGHSMGGYMSYRLAMDMSDTFTAVAPSAGLALRVMSKEKPNPVSVLHLHTADDRTVSINGDPNGTSFSALESIDLWRSINQNSNEGKDLITRENAVSKIWDGSSNDKVTAIVVFRSGGHVWQPLSTQIISEFFYNHPSRGNSIRIDDSKLKDLYSINTAVEIQTQVQDPSSIANIKVFANNKEIGNFNSSPYSLTWIPTAKGNIHLSLKAELKNGEKIHSTNVPSIWVTKPDINTNGTVSSSANELDSLLPEYTIDGKMYTRWSTPYSDNHWLMLDLNEIKEISGLTIIWETAYAKKYNIEVSLDNKTWETVYSTKSGEDGEAEITFKSRNAQYIRINAIERGTEWGFSIWEVLVH